MLLSNTLVLARGGWPHRDFYTIYPPGIYFLILGWWKLFGIGVLAARYLSVGLHAAIVVLAGLAGGWLARRRFAWLPAGLVALWSAVVGGPPLAWWAALAAAFATVVTLARVTDAVRHRVSGGLASRSDGFWQLDPAPFQTTRGACLPLSIAAHKYGHVARLHRR